MTILAFLLAPEGERVLAMPTHRNVILEAVVPDDVVWNIREGYTDEGPMYVETRWLVLLRDETSALYTREVPT